MKHVKTQLIYAAGTLASGAALKYLEWPDSLFACLSLLIAAEVISGMLRMCDKLLDPPSAIFLIFCEQRPRTLRCHSSWPMIRHTEKNFRL